MKLLLDRLIAQRDGKVPTRKWWDAMRDEADRPDDTHGDAGHGAT